jgi:hypothetical protein
MKNILIPADFSKTTLDMICLVAGHYLQPVNVILFHALKQEKESAGADERRDARLVHLLTDDFRHACKKIRQQYQGIKHISVKTFYGNSATALAAFLRLNKVDEIVLVPASSFRKTTVNSISPVPMLKKCGIPVIDHLFKEHTPT